MGPLNGETSEHVHTDVSTRVENLFHHVVEYLDTRWDLIVLNLSEKGLSIASALITGLVLAFFGGIALVFASIALAIWLGQLLEQPATGYLIVAGFYVLVLVIMLSLAKNYVRTAIANTVLESIQDDDDEKTS